MENGKRSHPLLLHGLALFAAVNLASLWRAGWPWGVAGVVAVLLVVIGMVMKERRRRGTRGK